MDVSKRVVRNATRWGIALLAVLSLAACAEKPVEPPPPPPAVEPPPPPPKPAPVETPRPAPRPAAPAAKKGPSGPAELVGLDETGVRKHLGEPEQVHDDGAAHVLTYRNGKCVLDLVFFLDVKTGLQKVLSFQLESGSPRAAEARACYARMKGGK